MKASREQLQKTGQEQIALIQEKADPVIAQLAKKSFEIMSSNGAATGEGAKAVNPYGSIETRSSVLSCPTGQYLAGITVNWGGTCNGKCDADGGTVHELVPTCRKLVP